jgi:hypothetical protein
MKKVFEFCGSPEMLIALLYSDDVCQTIKDEVRASGKVSLFMFAEDEPYFVPDNDDIQITKTGEDIRPQVNLGELVPIEDDLHYEEIAALDGRREPDNEEWIEWNGGDRPVGKDAVVNVMFRSGETQSKLCEADAWSWKHYGRECDIVAYKIIHPSGGEIEVVGT